MEKYLISRIYSHVPEALEIRLDLPSIENARQVLFPRLKAEIQKLEKGINLLTKLLSDETHAKSKVESQVTNLGKVLNRSTVSLNEAETEFRDLCKYLGEEESSDCEKIFGQLCKLVESIEFNVNALAAKEKRRAKQQQIDMNKLR